MRICVMYDCLFPWTVGGAERWYREMAERFAAEGHEVTYLTLLQWDETDVPDLPGVKVVAVGRKQRPLYNAAGGRKVGPTLFFGLGAFWHFLRHRRRYDIVHTASFPFFSLLAAAFVLPISSYRIFCDWHEVWSLSYWQEYLGKAGGRVGWFVQWLCAQVPHEAYTFSRLHGARVTALAKRRDVTVLSGEFGGDLTPPAPSPAPARPHVVYAGRWIPEKRVGALVPALIELRKTLPNVHATLLGAGPERQAILAEIEATGASEFIEAPGFVATDVVEATFDDATVMVLPSSREGYGMVVVESSARGIPVVVTAAVDNAATELVDEGQNGFIAASADPAPLAAAIRQAIDGGDALRVSTAAWFAGNAERLSIQGSLTIIAAHYARRA